MQTILMNVVVILFKTGQLVNCSFSSIIKKIKKRYNVLVPLFKMSVEDLKAKLAQQVVVVFDMCDEIMKEEGHVGILDVTTMMFIGALHSACGRIKNIDQMRKEDFVYPLPPLEVLEAKLVEEDVEEDVEAVENAILE